MITTILFDLDGTLLPMDMDVFTGRYFELLASKMTGYGYDPKELIQNIWAGTKVMVKNDGRLTNEEAFWNFFCEKYGEERLEDQKVFDAYYANEFNEVQKVCGFNEKVPQLIQEIKRMGFREVLATNPLFPEIATRGRASWEGLSVDDFEYFTTYENSHYCKPNVEYYKELLEKIQVQPEECLMVGNDVDEDMIAETIGMSVFLITDCMLNRSNKDISRYPHGDFDDLLEYIKGLN